MADIIDKPLASLINGCFYAGTFPNALKLSVVTSVFKKGNTDDLNAFCPLFLIPVVGNIIENIVKKQLHSFMEVISLLCSGQFDSRKKMSTTKAFLQLVADKVKGLEKGKHSQLEFCDLSKTFDCVSHNILYEKLHS